MEAANFVITKIVLFQRKNLTFHIVAGFIHFILFLLIIWLSTFLADSVFYFKPEVRWFILILNSIITVYLFYRHFLSPLIKYFFLSDKKNLTPITKVIGEYYPNIADKLTNIYQLITSESPRSSLSIKNFAISNFAHQISAINFADKLYSDCE